MTKYLNDVAPNYINEIISNQNFDENYNWILANCNQNGIAEKHHKILLKIGKIINHNDFTINCDHFYQKHEFKTFKDYKTFFIEKIEDILENTYMCNRLDPKEFPIKEKKDLITIGINRCTYFQCHYCGNPRFKSLIFNTKDNSVTFAGGTEACKKEQYTHNFININKELTITNIFDYKEILNDRNYDINYLMNIGQLVDDLSKKNIGYAQTGSTSMNVYHNKQANKILFVYPYPNKETKKILKDYKKVGTICCDIWRVMFSDLSVSKTNLNPDDFQHFSVKMKSGKYAVKTDLFRKDDIAVELALVD